MKNLKIAGLLALLVVALTTLVKTNAQNSEVTLDILSGAATYNVSGTIYLSGWTASFSERSENTVTNTFSTNTFVVEDLKGTDAYNMKIKSADLTAGGFTIASGNVYMKLASTTPALTGDVTCNMTTDLLTSYTALSSDINWLKKGADNKICKAAITPIMGVKIPASQAVGHYAATLTVTSTIPTYNGSLTY